MGWHCRSCGRCLLWWWTWRFLGFGPLWGAGSRTAEAVHVVSEGLAVADLHSEEEGGSSGLSSAVAGRAAQGCVQFREPRGPLQQRVEVEDVVAGQGRTVGG